MLTKIEYKNFIIDFTSQKIEKNIIYKVLYIFFNYSIDIDYSKTLDLKWY